MKKQETGGEIIIEQMQVGNAAVWIKGLSPLIYNAMSRKPNPGLPNGGPVPSLLSPPGRKTGAEKAQNLKHHVIEEYRASVYANEDGKAETRLMFPASAFKSAMMDAALEIPGAKKAQIGRLVWTCGDKINVYGTPKLYMAVVRSADMNHTPDVRTRAILPEWCACLSVRFVMPTINETVVARLLETAGLIIGVGDFRQAKGKGNYGQFQIADKADCAEIIASGGRADQDEALQNPTCYDRESEALLEWYRADCKRRGK
jgi:hypothetical protein